MKILHAADLHLDSPLCGLESRTDAPPHVIELFRTATRRAYMKLIEFCLKEEVSLLLLAGDLFDGDLDDANAAVCFAGGIERFAAAGGKIALVLGNHDAECRLSEHLNLHQNAHRFGSASASTHLIEELGIAVHGQSYAAKDVRSNLAKHYPARVDGLLNVGLLHTNAIASSEHAPYAPCKLEDLTDHGYDYFALGHIHKRQVLATDPYVVYPGNLQGRSVRETGARGATLIDVEDLKIKSVKHVDLDVVRWAKIALDATGFDSIDAVIDGVRAALRVEVDAAGARPLLARVVIGGATPIASEFDRKSAMLANQIRTIAAGLRETTIEKIEIVVTQNAKRYTTAIDADFLDAIEQEIKALSEDPTIAAAAVDELSSLSRKVKDHLDPDRFAPLGERLRELAPKVRALIMGKLLAGAVSTDAGEESES